MPNARQRRRHKRPAAKIKRLHMSLLNNEITAKVSSSSIKLSIFLLVAAAANTIIQQAECQQQQQPAANNIILQQYQRSSPIASIQNSNNNNNNNNNNFLVNTLVDQRPSFAQSLPLTRQQQQQQQDLDNVIESTTSQLPFQSQSSFSSARLSATALATTTPTCQLPPTWTGKWYQANKEPIRVTNTEISDKGLCRDKKGDKYLFESIVGTSTTSSGGKQHTPCLVCLVINERHLNVLQYKESNCQPIPAQYLNRSTNSLIIDNDHSLLDSICSDITGDAQLESLFRLDTPAIECPISGQYNFNYDNCREPQSSLDSCINKKQLNFKFAACPDVPGSESKSEVLKCYADWSEGNNYYMIGRLEHASNHQDKGKFRCFVYERSPDGSIQMAQSLEESCYGLINANEGPKTLRLTIRPPTNYKCHFPAYIQSQSENWLSVDNSLIYMFNQNSTKYQVKETKEGNVIEEATCLQQFTYTQAPAPHHPHFLQQQPQQHHQPHIRSSNLQAQQVMATSRRYPPSSPSSYNHADQSLQQQPTISAASKLANDIVYLVQITKNCHTTDYCVRFYKRTNGIVQIDYFLASAAGDGQHRCRNAHFGTPQTQIITSTNLEHQRCPFEGAYTIEAPTEAEHTYNPSNIFICPRQSFLTAQCDHPSRLRIHYKCSPARYTIKNLYCLGSWTANGLVRLLLADDERQRYSAWYRDIPPLIAAQSQQQLQDASATPQQQPLMMMTRSQQLVALSSASNSATAAADNNQQQQYLLNSLATTVQLQIALITPLPAVAKPMQVTLTRRNQCSDLRGYLSQGSYGSPMSAISSSSMPSYAPSAAASSASSIVKPNHHQHPYNSSMLIMIFIVTLLTLLHHHHQHHSQATSY